MTYSIGLTGGIGSGKSTVSQLFEDLGIDVIDSDKIARDVVSPGQPALETIKKKLGDDAILPDGSLNRSYVRAAVFSDKRLKTWLDQLLHPLIRSKTESLIEHSSSPYCIVDVPLLAENNMAERFNRVLVIDCDEDVQIERASKRDGCDTAMIKKIMALQASREQRLAIANDIIQNDNGLETLKIQVKQLHQKYLTDISTGAD